MVVTPLLCTVICLSREMTQAIAAWEAEQILTSLLVRTPQACTDQLKQ